MMEFVTDDEVIRPLLKVQYAYSLSQTRDISAGERRVGLGRRVLAGFAKCRLIRVQIDADSQLPTLRGKSEIFVVG